MYVRIVERRNDGIVVRGAKLHITGAALVQSIGNVVVILRRSAKPDPRLSNLVRAL